MSIENFIKEIDEIENIDLKSVIKTFEKKLHKCFKLYKEKSGYEDYKMNDLDYIILYSIWKENNLKNCINEYLIIMYSYYKIEEFYFPIDKFSESMNSLSLINKTEIINIIHQFITKLI